MNIKTCKCKYPKICRCKGCGKQRKCYHVFWRSVHNTIYDSIVCFACWQALDKEKLNGIDW